MWQDTADGSSVWTKLIVGTRIVKVLYLTVDTSPETMTLLVELDAIFIEFAGFNDGRGYSFVALLRRQGFQAWTRAVGDVFKDVLNYMMRFDTFVIKEGKDVQEAAAGLADFTHPYPLSTAVPNQIIKLVHKILMPMSSCR